MDYQEVVTLERDITIPKYEESFQHVCENLVSLSTRLRDLLPDPSIGPQERLERIARIVPNSLMISQNYRTARAKLKDLRHRLDELVPEPMSYEKKLDFLVTKINDRVPGEKRLVEKLELLGDRRISDTGR